VNFKKGDFIGRDAALAERDTGGALRLIALSLAAIDADVSGDEPVWIDGRALGWVTSGGYAHAAGASIALAYVPKELAQTDAPMSVEILGQQIAAKILAEPIFDPQGLVMRS
jgi:dimethylglycine dehydrogenase